ncbi:hypothetical protein PT7_0166 [Pusillimonas sp. T7-7]|nr:hypothetical protein PT7_0166 [Pusillimonas sp. T7-7]
MPFAKQAEMNGPNKTRIHARISFFQPGMALLKAAILASQYWHAAISQRNAALLAHLQW